MTQICRGEISNSGAKPEETNVSFNQELALFQIGQGIPRQMKL